MMKKGVVACFSVALMFIVVISGCFLEKKSKYSDLELGWIKLTGEDMPIDAIEYLQRSIEEEPATRTRAKVLLLIAYRRAMTSKVAEATQAIQRYQASEQQLLSELQQQAPQAAEQLIRIINDQNRIQRDAAQVLVDLGSPAVPVIVDGLRRYTQVQGVYLDVLEKMGPVASEGLVEAAQDESLATWVRSRVIQALGRIGDPKTISALESIRANSKDNSIRMEATVALYALGKHEYEAAIVEGLDSDHIVVRRIAARAMVDLNSSPTDRILQALNDPDAEVRESLVLALAKHPDPRAQEPLIQLLLNDPDESVKNAARAALLDYGEVIAKRLIKELPGQTDWKVRLRIVSLLRDPKVITGIDKDGAYQIDKFYREKEDHPSVKEELVALLNDKALPQP